MPYDREVLASFWRACALVLFAAGLASCNAAHARSVEVESGELSVSDARPRPTSVATIPFAPRPEVNLDAVWWTAPRNESVGRLADRWGLTEKSLLALNPTLSGRGVATGERLLVYRYHVGTVSRSVGAPNRGRIENAAPFPTGSGWVLRAYRPRTYATRQTVRELAASLAQWREQYPHAHPVKLGEFSRREGGRVRPHKSHRTGRDVDIGYVMNDADTGHRFVAVTETNLDAPATWGLVRRLLADGAVEQIFMADSVQEQLLPFAAETMTDAQQRATFSIAALDARAKKKATIKAWRGHDDHMHVRFGCTQADLDCRGAVPRKRRRRRANAHHKSRHKKSRRSKARRSTSRRGTRRRTQSRKRR